MPHLLACHDIVKTDFIRGENCSLYDASGNRYLDFESGIWSAALGHSHPRVNAVLHQQIDQLMHLGTRYPSALAESAALDVLEITGIGEGKCVFLSSGSEAVEFGVQAVRRLTRRPLLLTFSVSYLAAFGSAGRKDADEWLLVDAACPDPEACLKDIPFERIGGFIFEPGGSGSAFVQFSSARLVQEIARRVRQTGGLLMANEITTGMGRTGAWFGFQHYDVQPDIVSLGKGLGNGYPVSAVALSLDAASRLEADGFRYAQSHQNDPLGCAVAREVIAVMREGAWIDKGRALGESFLDGLDQLRKSHPLVKDARGRGPLLALEFQSDARITAASAYDALLKRGFLVGCYPAGNLLRFDPALTMDRKDVDALLAALEDMLVAAERKAGSALEEP